MIILRGTHACLVNFRYDKAAQVLRARAAPLVTRPDGPRPCSCVLVVVVIVVRLNLLVDYTKV